MRRGSSPLLAGGGHEWSGRPGRPRTSCRGIPPGRARRPRHGREDAARALRRRPARRCRRARGVPGRRHTRALPVRPGSEYARRLLAGAHGNSSGTAISSKEASGGSRSSSPPSRRSGAGGERRPPGGHRALRSPAASPLDELSPGTAKSSGSSPRGRTNARDRPGALRVPRDPRAARLADLRLPRALQTGRQQASAGRPRIPRESGSLTGREACVTGGSRFRWQARRRARRRRCGIASPTRTRTSRQADEATRTATGRRSQGRRRRAARPGRPPL